MTLSPTLVPFTTRRQERTHLSTEILVVVELAPYEVTVLARGDHALSLDAMATRSSQDLAGHVSVLFTPQAAVWVSGFRAYLQSREPRMGSRLFIKCHNKTADDENQMT